YRVRVSPSGVPPRPELVLSSFSRARTAFVSAPRAAATSGATSSTSACPSPAGRLLPSCPSRRPAGTPGATLTVRGATARRLGSRRGDRGSGMANRDVDGSAAAPPGGRLGLVRLILRPIGYWSLAWVWLTIWFVGILLAPGSVAYVYADDEVQLGNLLRETPFIGLVLQVVLFVPLLAAIMGPGAMFWVPTMAWPLALLSFAYAFRGLRPSYAREPLSCTTQAPRGGTPGPPTIGTVALSLKPVRRTRYTDTLMKWYMAGWDLHMEIFF